MQEKLFDKKLPSVFWAKEKSTHMCHFFLISKIFVIY